MMVACWIASSALLGMMARIAVWCSGMAAPCCGTGFAAILARMSAFCMRSLLPVLLRMIAILLRTALLIGLLRRMTLPARSLLALPSRTRFFRLSILRSPLPLCLSPCVTGRSLCGLLCCGGLSARLKSGIYWCDGLVMGGLGEKLK